MLVKLDSEFVFRFEQLLDRFHEFATELSIHNVDDGGDVKFGCGQFLVAKSRGGVGGGEGIVVNVSGGPVLVDHRHGLPFQRGKGLLHVLP